MAFSVGLSCRWARRRTYCLTASGIRAWRWGDSACGFPMFIPVTTFNRVIRAWYVRPALSLAASLAKSPPGSPRCSLRHVTVLPARPN
jgi:hypothetical protein